MSSTTVARHRASAPAATPQVAATPAVRRSLARRLANLFGNLVMLACTLAFLAIAVGPHLFDYRTSTMLTGSMSPGINPGDMVVTQPKPSADLQVGDVISYQIPIEDHRVETHRVTSVEHQADGTIAIQTKGDANENVDPWVAIVSTESIYEVQTVVPKVGAAIRVLRAPVVQDGILWLALGGVLVLGLSMIWGKKPADDDVEPREQS
jgi:signal peptidase